MANHINNWHKDALILVFLQGAHPEEMKTCIVERDRQLRLAGAKLRNKPDSAEQSARFIAGLPEKAMNVVRVWFVKNAKFEGVMPLNDAIEQLISLSKGEVVKTNAKKYWRSVLAVFCSEPQNKQILNFLTKAPDSIESKVVPDLSSQANRELVLDAASVAQCLSAVKGESNVDGPLAALILGIVAAGRGDGESVEQARKAIAASGVSVSQKLEELVVAASERAAVTTRGVRLRAPKKLADFGPVDPEVAIPLAVVKRYLTTGRFFARVLAVVIDGQVVILTSAEAKQIYKLTGDITALFGNASPQYVVDELGLWKVEHRITDQSTQYAISSHKARVYDIVKVPLPSTDPDGVRTWLQTQYQAKQGLFPIFELMDGVLIRMPGDNAEPSSFKFERALDSYEVLEAYDLGIGRRVVLGPLPAPTGKYDCAPVTTLIKRMLNRARESIREFPSFTHAQTQALCDFLRQEEVDSIASGLPRARERLLEVTDFRQALAECLADIMALPQVIEQIELEKGKFIDEFVKSRTNEEAELARLKEQQRLAEAAAQSARQNAKQQEVDLVRQIKAAFEKARADGVKTLADVALFKGLLAPIVSPVSSGEVTALTPPPIADALAEHEIGGNITSLIEFRNALARSAYSSSLSPQLLYTVVAAAQTCGAIGLTGHRRGTVVSAVAAVISGGVYCQVSVGADIFSPADLMRRPAVVMAGTSRFAMLFGEFLERQSALGRTCIVDLVGTNRAPPEAYLPEFIEVSRVNEGRVCIPWVDGTGQVRGGKPVGPVLLFLGFSFGQSTFPVAAPLSKEIPVSAVDFDWGDEDDEDSPRRMSLRNVSALDWTSMFPQSSGSLQQRLSASIATLGMSHSEADAISSAMLQAARPGYDAKANEGLPKRLQEALAESFSPVFDASPLDKTGAY